MRSFASQKAFYIGQKSILKSEKNVATSAGFHKKPNRGACFVRVPFRHMSPLQNVEAYTVVCRASESQLPDPRFQRPLEELRRKGSTRGLDPVSETPEKK